MDGYAVNSETTRYASSGNPIFFHVEGLVAAGDEPCSVPNTTGDQSYPCVEIMAGGPFPTAVRPDNAKFDCCAKFEDVEKVTDSITGEDYIEIQNPAR